MESFSFIIVALAILGFGLVSGRAQNSVLTPPMVFVLLGILVGPLVLGLIAFDIESRWIGTLAELTLVLVLFTDATRIDLMLLRREHNLPLLMLVIGLPLTIVAGTLVAASLFPALGIWECAVLAAILAPTDAALGQAVVSSPQVPVRIRQGLNVESGLNDGVVLPVLLILVSCAGMAAQSESAGYWTSFTLKQVGLGPLVGIGVGYVGGRLVELASRTGWMNHSFQQLSALGLAVLAFSLAGLVGGNGFIAAFCAGLTLGNSSRQICACLVEFAEAEGQLLTLLVFLLFGVVMVPIAVAHLSWSAVVFAILSLTFIRMVPVAISLLGSRLRWFTVVFLGWFGPRGIASILFALLVLEQSTLPGREEILVVVVTTVLLSVVAHGVSAFPGASWYAGQVRRAESCSAETMAVPEMPLRISDHADANN